MLIYRIRVTQVTCVCWTKAKIYSKKGYINLNLLLILLYLLMNVFFGLIIIYSIIQYKEYMAKNQQNASYQLDKVTKKKILILGTTAWVVSSVILELFFDFI